MAVEAIPVAPATAATLAPDVEAKAEIKPADTKPEEAKEKDSKRFAALARKEKEIIADKQRVKAEWEALVKAKEDVAETRKAKEQAKTNPLAFLEAHGLTYEDVTQFLLNNSKPTADLTVKALKDEVDALKKQTADEREASIKAERAKIEAEENRILQEHRAQVIQFVKEHESDYELTTLYGKEEEVPALIEIYFERHKKLLTPKEAADQVEKYYEEMAAKATTTKKFQAKAQPQPKGDEKRIDSAQRRTLSNDMTATTPSAMTPARSEQERIERALAALERASR